MTHVTIPPKHMIRRSVLASTSTLHPLIVSNIADATLPLEFRSLLRRAARPSVNDHDVFADLQPAEFPPGDVGPDARCALTPLDPERHCHFNRAAFLACFPQDEFSTGAYLANMATFGANTACAPPTTTRVHRNHGSYFAHRAACNEMFHLEAAQGRVRRLPGPPPGHFHSSPLAVLVKTSGKLRIINDASYGVDAPNARIDLAEFPRIHLPSTEQWGRILHCMRTLTPDAAPLAPVMSPPRPLPDTPAISRAAITSALTERPPDSPTARGSSHSDDSHHGAATGSFQRHDSGTTPPSPTDVHQWKVDATSAYRWVATLPCLAANSIFVLHEGEHGQQRTFWCDMQLSMGVSSAVALYTLYAQTCATWVRLAGHPCFQYIDDGCGASARGQDTANAAFALAQALQLVCHVGISKAKLEPASPDPVTILGVSMDPNRGACTLPDAGWAKLSASLATWLHRGTASLRDFEQLAGRLCWASRVVRGLRSCYLHLANNWRARRRRLAHRVGLTKRLRVPPSVLANLAVVAKVAAMRLVGPLTWPTPAMATITCSTDAATNSTGGAGGWCSSFGGLYISQRWPESVRRSVAGKTHITCLESLAACALLTAVAARAEPGSVIRLLSDNTAACAVVSKHGSGAGALQPVARSLVMTMVQRRVFLVSEHRPGSSDAMQLADHLSRHCNTSPPHPLVAGYHQVTVTEAQWLRWLPSRRASLSTPGHPPHRHQTPPPSAIGTGSAAASTASGS